MALLLPWYIFLFVGAFDWGFYSHALISTESAARVAALYLASGPASQSQACTYVLEELRIAANVGTTVTTCAALPVIVSSTCTTTATLSTAQVAVTYQTLNLIPIPYLLEPQATLYRVVQMPMQSGTCSLSS
jgi:hypothetical protein